MIYRLLSHLQGPLASLPTLIVRRPSNLHSQQACKTPESHTRQQPFFALQRPLSRRLRIFRRSPSTLQQESPGAHFDTFSLPASRARDCPFRSERYPLAGSIHQSSKSHFHFAHCGAAIRSYTHPRQERSVLGIPYYPLSLPRPLVQHPPAQDETNQRFQMRSCWK